MTPKDKALELTEKFVAPTMDRGLCGYVQSIAIAKQCALIAVDEIVKRTRSVNTMPPNCQKIDDNTKEYWQDVKKEIELL